MAGSKKEEDAGGLLNELIMQVDHASRLGRWNSFAGKDNAMIDMTQTGGDDFSNGGCVE